jgi:hypothetical protein
MASDLIFVGQFVASKAGKTGLTVTVDVDRYTISDGSRSSLVTAGSATEGRRGLYHYRLASADLSLYQYVATFITADATVDQQEIAAIGLVVPDALTSSRLAPTTAGRTLDVSATGEAGVDWANVGTPESTVALTNTQINSVLGTVKATDEDGAALATAEELAALAGGATLTVSSPVAENGDTELYAGDDYNNSDGRALEWSSSDWPDLTDATITLYLRAPDGSKFSKAGSAPVVGSGSQTARVELTAAETATLIDWPTPSTLRLRATLAVSGRIVTLVTGVLTVAEDIS